MVTELATASLVARIQLAAPQNAFTRVTEDEVAFQAVSDSEDPGQEERFALPSGELLSRGPPEPWFTTPLGRARLKVQLEEDGAVSLAECWIDQPSGTYSNVASTTVLALARPNTSSSLRSARSGPPPRVHRSVRGYRAARPAAVCAAGPRKWRVGL